MNWRKGFLRTWIAASFSWIAFISWYRYPIEWMNFKEAEHRIERVASGRAELWVDLFSFEDRKIEQETCIVALISPTHHVYCDLPSEILGQIEMPVHSLPLETGMYGLNIDDAKTLVIGRERDTLWKKLWQDFLNYFPFAFYPPIFLLIVYFLVVWVLRGFKDKAR